MYSSFQFWFRSDKEPWRIVRPPHSALESGANENDSRSPKRMAQSGKCCIYFAVNSKSTARNQIEREFGLLIAGATVFLD
jgi:hypothetical protein